MRHEQRPGMTDFESLRGHFQGFQQSGATGPRAMIAAIIAQAALDYKRGDAGAREFFRSAAYRHYLSWLELPTNYLPLGVQL